MSDEVYCYAGTNILRNRFGITDGDELDKVERRLVADRFAEGPPVGAFDLSHLRAIHRHLFQDIYEWAGEIRTLEITKGGSQFMFARFIATGMADVHRRIVEWGYLHALNANEFAAQAGEIAGDINHLHPFREGNGRTLMVYLQQMAAGAGHALEIRGIVRERWIAASIAAHSAHYDAMRAIIHDAIARPSLPQN